MHNTDSRRAIINLAVGLVFGYSIGFLFVLLGKSTILYYLGGMLLLFSIILSLILILSLAAIYWDIKKETKSGVIGSIIYKYDDVVTSIASESKETAMFAESKEGSIDIEYDE